MNKQWPKDGKTVSFHEITGPLVKALKFTYNMQRKNREMDVSWKGYDIGNDLKATSFSPDENLKAESLAYQEEDQGRDASEVIIGIAVQLGIEQGKRHYIGNELKTHLNLATLYSKELKNVLERMSST